MYHVCVLLFIQNEVGAEKTEIEKSHQSAEDKINQLQAHKMVKLLLLTMLFHSSVQRTFLKP